MNFIRLIGVALGAASIASSAYAADLPSRVPPVVAAAPDPLNWTGFYTGVNIGYASLKGGSTNGLPVANDGSGGAAPNAGGNASTAASIFSSAGGVIGGAQIGYNYQISPMFLAGLETDMDGAGVNRTTDTLNGISQIGFPANTLFTNIITQNKLNWLGTTRARVGLIATPALLIYATGGLAYGSAGVNSNFAQLLSAPGGCGVLCGLGAASTAYPAHFGWTVGGGVEWMFAPNWSVKAEGLYYDLGARMASSLIGIPNTGTGKLFETTAVTTTSRQSGVVARAGLNYHFDFLSPPDPIVAKY